MSIGSRQKFNNLTPSPPPPPSLEINDAQLNYFVQTFYYYYHYHYDYHYYYYSDTAFMKNRI